MQTAPSAPQQMLFQNGARLLRRVALKYSIAQAKY
jgi:hypothetical protein